MSVVFTTVLPDDPAGCHEAAATLRAAARAALAAADLLADQVALPREVFDGIAAREYRAAAAALVEDARGSAADTTALADALETYATTIAEVRDTLIRVRSDAVRAGLTVTPDGLVQWPPSVGTELDAAYRRLVATASDAQHRAAAADAAWWRAIQEHTKGPLPSRTHEGVGP